MAKDPRIIKIKKEQKVKIKLSGVEVEPEFSKNVVEFQGKVKLTNDY